MMSGRESSTHIHTHPLPHTEWQGGEGGDGNETQASRGLSGTSVQGLQVCQGNTGSGGGAGEYLGSSEKSGCLSRVCGISGGQRTYSGYQMCVSNHKPFWKWEASACVTDENMRLPEETGKPE